MWAGYSQGNACRKLELWEVGGVSHSAREKDL